MTMFRRNLFLPLLSVLFLSSCGILGDNGEQDDLETNRKRWQQYRIDNYEFELNKACFCPAYFYPARVVVRADTISAVLDPETGEPLRNPDNQEVVLSRYRYQSIDELFDVVEEAIRVDADHLQVEYDRILGYPRQIEIDYSTQVADDEVSYTIIDFEAGQ